MSEIAWIDPLLRSARPQAIGALLRYFRDLDRAEEAFQEACLRALRNWPVNGPPRDPAAWLILVGRNVALDDVRRRSRSEPLPDDAELSDLGDAEADIAERLDNSHYRDDVLRLLFICCHPDLPAVQQIALALRVVSGLSVKEIARAFLVSETAMEQRITRAKSRVARAEIPFEAPGAVERAERLAVVAAMIYLVFNEGYSASGGTVHVRAAALRGGDPAVAAAARDCSPANRRSWASPRSSSCSTRARRPGSTPTARSFSSRTRTAGRWNRDMIAEGLALIEKALRHRRPGPYQIQAAIAGVHAHAARPEDTDWSEIDQLYAALGAVAAVAGSDAQPRGGGEQAARAASGAGNDRASGRAARRLFPFFRRKGRLVDAARPRR